MDYKPLLVSVLTLSKGDVQKTLYRVNESLGAESAFIIGQKCVLLFLQLGVHLC